MQGSCTYPCKSELYEFVRQHHCCAATVEDADHLYWNILRHSHLQYIEADLKDREDPFDLGEPRRLSKYHLIANPEFDEKNVSDGNKTIFPCPASRVTASCAMGYYCNSLNWQPSCCNALECSRGSKQYPGACSCRCPDGYGGGTCDHNGAFIALEVTFVDETLDTLDIGKIRYFTLDLSKQISVKTTDIEWEEPVQDSSGRRVENSEKNIVRMKLRVMQSTFVDVDRVKDAITSVMCAPEYPYLKNFACDHGPAVWYNASLLNPIQPPSPPPTPPPPTLPLLPPAKVQGPFKINFLALMISLCLLFFILLATLSSIRIYQEQKVWEFYWRGRLSFFHCCCLIFCLKPIPADGNEFNRSVLKEEAVVRKRKEVLRSIQFKQYSEHGSTYGRLTPSQMQKTDVQEATKKFQSRYEPEQLNVKDTNSSHEIETMDAQSLDSKSISNERGRDFIRSFNPSPQNSKLSTLPTAPQGVELSTQAQLRWVEDVVRHDMLILAAVSPRERSNSADGNFSPFRNVLPQQELMALEKQHTPTILDFNATAIDAESPVVLVVDEANVQGTLQQPASRSSREHVLDHLERLRGRPSLHLTPRRFTQEPPTPTEPGITAELGFTPVERPKTPLSLPGPVRNSNGPDSQRPAAHLQGTNPSPHQAALTSNRKATNRGHFSIKKPPIGNAGVRLGSVYHTTDDELMHQLVSSRPAIPRVTSPGTPGARSVAEEASTVDSELSMADLLLGPLHQGLSKRVHADYEDRKSTALNQVEFTGKIFGF